MYIGNDTIEIQVPCLRISNYLELQELLEYLSVFDEDCEYYEFIEGLKENIRVITDNLDNCRTGEQCDLIEFPEYVLTIHGYNNIEVFKNILSEMCVDKCDDILFKFETLKEKFITLIENKITIKKVG